MEQTAHWGGRAPVDGGTVTARLLIKLVDDLVAELEDGQCHACAAACMGAGVYDHGYVLGYERLTDHARHRTARAIGCGASGQGR